MAHPFRFLFFKYTLTYSNTYSFAPLFTHSDQNHITPIPQKMKIVQNLKNHTPDDEQRKKNITNI